jgi:hypothetical protein
MIEIVLTAALKKAIPTAPKKSSTRLTTFGDSQSDYDSYLKILSCDSFDRCFIGYGGVAPDLDPNLCNKPFTLGSPALWQTSKFSARRLS